MSPERYSTGFRRRVRDVKAEFRREGLDIRDYSAVRELLRKIIPDFDERFSRYDSVFSNWHSVRVQILDLPLGGREYMKTASELRTNFQKEYDTPSKMKQDPNFWFNVSPVLQQITNMVAKGR